MGREVLVSIALAIVLIFGSSSPALAENIDTAKVGVEVGDWFVHEIVQGNWTFTSNQDDYEVAPGDLITSTVTGFSGDLIMVHTDHNGNEVDYSMNMSDRLDGFIVFNDWEYWAWQLDQSWNWGDDFFSNRTLMDQAEITEGWANYTIVNHGDSFNSTHTMHILWNDGSTINHHQRLDWDTATGALSYLYVNDTNREGTEPFTAEISEQRLIDQGHTDTFPWTSEDDPTSTSDPAPFWLSLIPLMVLVRSRRKQF